MREVRNKRRRLYWYGSWQKEDEGGRGEGRGKREEGRAREEAERSKSKPKRSPRKSATRAPKSDGTDWELKARGARHIRKP